MAAPEITDAPPAADAPAQPAEAPAPGRRRRGLVLAVASLVLAGGLGAAGWFLAPRLLAKADAPPAEARPEPPIRATVPVGSIVVNVAGENRRYLKVTVELGVADPKAAAAVEERKSQILDRLITILSGKSAASLASVAERDALKAELLAGIREDLALPEVSRLYFTEFIIQ